MRFHQLMAALALAGLAAGAAAQKSASEAIDEYRAMLADGNPADLFEAKGEALWKQKRGPKNASLEACDLGKGEMANVTALATYVASESKGLAFNLPQQHPMERSFYEAGKRLFFMRGGTHDFSCASCHGEDGKRIRLQDLPNLTKNPGDGVGFAAWPAYRVSNGQMWSMQLRLNDCLRQQRFPYPEFGSDALTAVSTYLGVNAKGAKSAAPTIKR
jgi:sulfur-oxidizing protein SoxA